MVAWPRNDGVRDMHAKASRRAAARALDSGAFYVRMNGRSHFTKEALKDGIPRDAVAKDASVTAVANANTVSLYKYAARSGNRTYAKYIERGASKQILLSQCDLDKCQYDLDKWVSIVKGLDSVRYLFVRTENEWEWSDGILERVARMSRWHSYTSMLLQNTPRFDLAMLRSFSNLKRLDLHDCRGFDSVCLYQIWNRSGLHLSELRISQMSDRVLYPLFEPGTFLGEYGSFSVEKLVVTSIIGSGHFAWLPEEAQMRELNLLDDLRLFCKVAGTRALSFGTMRDNLGLAEDPIPATLIRSARAFLDDEDATPLRVLNLNFSVFFVPVYDATGKMVITVDPMHDILEYAILRMSPIKVLLSYRIWHVYEDQYWGQQRELWREFLVWTMAEVDWLLLLPKSQVPITKGDPESANLRVYNALDHTWSWNVEGFDESAPLVTPTFKFKDEKHIDWKDIYKTRVCESDSSSDDNE